MDTYSGKRKSYDKAKYPVLLFFGWSGALLFGSWNVQNYPDSPEVFDSMGEYYLSQLDTLNSIEYFKKAVEIDNDYLSKEKLIKLEKKG